jgi:hypothetical protein
VVLLNWNGWRDTIECLESLSRVSYDAFSVIVVDNGSTDDSVSRIREYCRGGAKIESKILEPAGPSRPWRLTELTRVESEAKPPHLARSGTSTDDNIALILNERNYGFAEGSNIGIRYCLAALDPAYVLLLNNDTVVSPDFLSELVRVGDSDEKIGILGPKLLYYDYNGRSDVILYAGGAINPWREMIAHHVGSREIDEGQFDIGGETSWCSGAAMLIRSELVRAALLNTAYEFGLEDVEYCMNAKKRGYKVVYVPSSKVWHKVSISWKKLGKRIGRDIPRYFFFIRNNFSSAVYFYHLFVFFLGVLPRWAVTYAAEGRDRGTLRTFLGDMRRLLTQMVGAGPKG